jgi:hypothetical protein
MVSMVESKLVKEFKSAYLNVHDVKCKDLSLNEWTGGQLRSGIKALNFINNKKK